MDQKLSRGIEEIIEKDHLEKRLERGDKLRIKLGIDPTAKDLHLGHAVVLRKLRQFQDAGHTAVLIVGDFTALIGDPSGRSELRPVLSEKQVRENMRSYLKDAKKILSRKPLRFFQQPSVRSCISTARLIFSTKMEKGICCFHLSIYLKEKMRDLN